MKRSKAHNVYLSTQALDILVALKTCAGNSRYLLPSRYDANAPMSQATFNRITTAVQVRAAEQGLPLAPFTVHDLRRTGSTLLNELGFNSDWIGKCLAHEDGRSLRGVYNKAEYEVQRRHMLQEWSNTLIAWSEGRRYAPELVPPQMPGTKSLGLPGSAPTGDPNCVRWSRPRDPRRHRRGGAWRTSVRCAPGVVEGLAGASARRRRRRPRRAPRS